MKNYIQNYENIYKVVIKILSQGLSLRRKYLGDDFSMTMKNVLKIV